jgi:hypothetical protein
MYVSKKKKRKCNGIKIWNVGTLGRRRDSDIGGRLGMEIDGEVSGGAGGTVAVEMVLVVARRGVGHVDFNYMKAKRESEESGLYL